MILCKICHDTGCKENKQVHDFDEHFLHTTGKCEKCGTEGLMVDCNTAIKRTEVK